MKIKEIALFNFRCFKQKRVNFLDTNQQIRNFTVFIGDNGVGKTAILEGIAKAFVPVLRIINPNVAGDFLDIQNIDITHGQLGTAVEASVKLDDNIYEWHNQKKLASGADISGVSEILSRKNINAAMTQRLNNIYGENNIPVVLYYSINRMLISLPKRRSSKNKKIKTGMPFEALDNAFSIKNDYRSFFEWFKAEEDIELRNLRNGIKDTSKQLEIIRNVLNSMLKGYSNLRTETQPVRMLITDENGNDLSVTQLSGGYKAVFALVCDIASRLTLANPHSPNPLLCEALILIDELDLHLHPKWQKTIVSDLKRTFPKCQFIVTTHSPFIIQSLRKDEVINLENENGSETDTSSYWGWSIDEIQEQEMGINAKTVEYKRLLQEFDSAINEEDVDLAKRLYLQIEPMLPKNNEILKIMRLDMIGLGVKGV